jgi:hypothetical protein
MKAIKEVKQGRDQTLFFSVVKNSHPLRHFAIFAVKRKYPLCQLPQLFSDLPGLIVNFASYDFKHFTR